MLKLAVVHGQRVDWFAVDGDDFVCDGRIGPSGIKADEPKGLFFVVGEQCSLFFHRGVDMLIGEPGRVELVEVISVRTFNLPGIRTVAVCRHEHDAVDLVFLEESEDRLAFVAITVPSILAASFGPKIPRHGRADHLECSVGRAELLFEPLQLHRTQHAERIGFGVGSVVATVEHDEVDVTNRERIPAARLGIAAAVGRIRPVFTKDLERVIPLPERHVDQRPAPGIIRAEVVIVPDRIDRGLGREGAPFRS